MRFIVFEDDKKEANRLRHALGTSRVTVIDGPLANAWTYPGLDALYVSIPMAEKWGARPELNQLQVLATSEQEHAAGLPRYLIAGLATDPVDDPQPRALLHLILRKVVELARTDSRLLQHGADVVIGFMAPHLLLREVPAEDVGSDLTAILSASS